MPVYVMLQGKVHNFQYMIQVCLPSSVVVCTMSIFQNVPWRYDLPMLTQTRGFKPLNSAEVSWSTLFALVLNGGSKYDQVSLISISSCHLLPILATFYKKVGLFFHKIWKNSRKQGLQFHWYFDEQNVNDVMAILPTLSHTKAKRALNYM